MKILFKKMHQDAIIPTFGHGDCSNAGFDFYARLDKPVWIWPLCSVKIGTGVAWQPEEPSEPTGSPKTTRLLPYKPGMFIRGRSGVTLRGLSVSGGTIDAGYRGEIMIHARCFRLLPWIIKPGMRIAQGITMWLPIVEIKEAPNLNFALRGDRGFGSSGE